MRQKCVNCKFFIKATKKNIYEIGGVCKGKPPLKLYFPLSKSQPTRFNKCYLYEEKENDK